MGTVVTRPLCSEVDNDTIDKNPQEPSLSEEQVTLLEKSWNSIKINIANIGVMAFMNLFQTHPEVQDAFLPLQQLAKEDMQHSAILRSHALRVMGTVDKCLSRIRTPKKLQYLMHELGERHVKYNAKFDFIDIIGGQFVHAIRPHLQDTWDEELEKAWIQLFRVLCYYMKKGMKDNKTSADGE